MSGKRLLDVAVLLKASANVVSRALALRAGELQNYGKTSSLVRALELKVARTGRNAGVAPSNSHSRYAAAPRPDFASQEDGVKAAFRSKGQDRAGLQDASQPESLEQDHFYQRSEANSVSDPSPTESLSIKQKAASEHPLPDGTIPASEDLPATESQSNVAFDPQRARELQRQAEKQIPSQPAEPPPDSSGGVLRNGDQGLSVDQEQDVFSNRPRKAGPALSALPRVKLPKNTGTTQESYDHASKNYLNPDVFHSGRAQESLNGATSLNMRSTPDDRDLPEETYAQLFQSFKVASKLKVPAIASEKTTSEFSKPKESSDSENADLHQLASDLKTDVNQEKDARPKVSRWFHQDRFAADGLTAISRGSSCIERPVSASRIEGSVLEDWETLAIWRIGDLYGFWSCRRRPPPRYRLTELARVPSPQCEQHGTTRC